MSATAARAAAGSLYYRVAHGVAPPSMRVALELAQAELSLIARKVPPEKAYRIARSTPLVEA